MNYAISEHAWTTIHNMHAQLRLVASLASQSGANDMQDLGVFLEVLASDASYVLDDAEPIRDPALPTEPVERASSRINPRRHSEDPTQGTALPAVAQPSAPAGSASESPEHSATCSFCGASNTAAAVMVQGPGVCICDACVGLAASEVESYQAASGGAT